MTELTAQQVIDAMKLVPLPEEGGFYRETFRDSGVIPSSALPEHSGERRYSTCIYYLITPESYSGLHAVKSYELFHFYCGDPVRMVQIDSSGKLSELILGSNFLKGEELQTAVPPMVWQGTKLLGKGSWALLGCTVAPGFEFADFRGANFEQLSAKFPQHTKLIREFTHS